MISHCIEPCISVTRVDHHSTIIFLRLDDHHGVHRRARLSPVSTKNTKRQASSGWVGSASSGLKPPTGTTSSRSSPQRSRRRHSSSTQASRVSVGRETHQPGKRVVSRTRSGNRSCLRSNGREGVCRTGTAATKVRTQVAGSRRKPWRQKGTGRARVGDRRSPIWRGGGAIFGPHPRDHSQKLPKKARRRALHDALLGKVRDSEVVAIDEFPLDVPKTRVMATLLTQIGVDVRLSRPAPWRRPRFV